LQNKERNPLSKSLSLLRWMMEGDIESIGVRSAAKALGMTPSSTHRVISALVDEGFLQKDVAGGRYELGLEMMRLAHRAAERWPIRTIALAPMHTLVDTCDEAAFLNLYDHDRQELIGAASVESSQVLRYVVELHKWKPVHVGAGGWAVIAFLSAADRRSVYERSGLKPLTELSITDPDQLEMALAEVHERGYAITHGTRIPGSVGLAAPLFGPSGVVMGSIGISMPEQRFSADKQRLIVAGLLQCTSDIMEKIGGRRPREVEAASPTTREKVNGQATEPAADA
jgi:IclR family acetate operon transcriptional repressor